VKKEVICPPILIVINPLISHWDLGAGETEVLSYALSHSEFTAIVDGAAS
jgi:hypothetical protein